VRRTSFINRFVLALNNESAWLTEGDVDRLIEALQSLRTPSPAVVGVSVHEAEFGPKAEVK